MPSDRAEVLRRCHVVIHPWKQTPSGVTFIVLIEAGLSGQQSNHSHVDLSSAV